MVASREIEIMGAPPQSIPSYLSTLDYFLTKKVDTILSSAVVAEKQSKGGTLSLIEAVAEAMGKSTSRATAGVSPTNFGWCRKISMS